MRPVDPDIYGMAFMEIGKNQPEYLTLPARVDFREDSGPVVTCWILSWKERLTLLFTGKLYLSVLTFKKPFQPVKISLYKSEVL